MSEQRIRNSATQISNFATRVRNLSGNNSLTDRNVRYEIESLSAGLEKEAKELASVADEIKVQAESVPESEGADGKAKAGKAK